MSDFQTIKTVRSRKQRQCPECRAGIGIGQTYRRETGSYDGDFYTAIMCEPCGAFADRYVSSMRNASFLNADEVSFTFGDIINEAAEFVEHEAPDGQCLSMPRKREAVHALFDEFDKIEREARRLEAAQRKEARIRQAEYAADLSRRMFGSAPPLPDAISLGSFLEERGR